MHKIPEEVQTRLERLGWTRRGYQGTYPQFYKAFTGLSLTYREDEIVEFFVSIAVSDVVIVKKCSDPTSLVLLEHRLRLAKHILENNHFPLKGAT